METDGKKPDYDELLFRLRQMEEKMYHLDKLTHDVTEIKELSEIGESVANEVHNEIAQRDALKQHNIIIPYLDKKIEEKIHEQDHTSRGKRPLLESEILEAQKYTNSAAAAARRLRVSYPTYKKYAKMYNIFKVLEKGKPSNVVSPINPYKGKFPLDKILKNEFPEFPIHRLKDKLIRSGLKKAECEQCGFCERRLTDGKIPLLLNFEDGDRHNHQLENLKIYCFNCTFVSGRGYIKRGTATFNMDPDVLQGSKFPLKPRF